MRLPAEFDKSATELPVELTALLTPPERRVLVPCAAPERTSPVPVCDIVSEFDRRAVYGKRCDSAYSDLTGDEIAGRAGDVRHRVTSRAYCVVGTTREQSVGALCDSGLNIAEAGLFEC
jgi:hypothetical protein